MRAHRRLRLATLLPGAVLAPMALVLAPGPSVAQDALQSRWSQSVRTVHVSALPVDVTVRLTAVPSDATTSYALALRPRRVVVTVAPEPGDEKGTWSSSATFSLPGDTACGTYTLTAVLAVRSARTAPPTAGGAIEVVGCPPELEVAPDDEVRTAPTLPWSFRARQLPAQAVGGRLLVDGEQVGPELSTTSHWAAAELARDCGNHDVQVVARTGEVLETRTTRLRCPSAVLEQDAVDRTALPLDLQLDVRELASGTPFEVQLDGDVVARSATDATGSTRVTVPVPDRSACGPHDLVVRQALPPVPALQPYPEPEPEPQVPSSAPTARPTAAPTTRPTTRPTATVATLPTTHGPVVVLRAAVQDLPAAGRTAEVTVPLTVRCPQTPTLEVTPPVRADDGRPVTYDLRGDGFGDDAEVELTAGGTVVPVARADSLGRMTAQVALRLPCGSTTFTATDADGRSAQDAVEVRCPSLRLDPDTVSSAELPRSVSAQAAGFDGGVALDVLLDGALVGRTTGDAGTAVLPLRAAPGLSCGHHDVTVRDVTTDSAPQARATLTVTCPPRATPVLDVSPEVVTDGHVVGVAGSKLPPGELRLVWRLADGTRLPATRRPVWTVDGRLRLDVLILRGEPAGPRQLLVVGGGAVVGDADTTLVVLDSVQPGRTADSRLVLLGRR